MPDYVFGVGEIAELVSRVISAEDLLQHVRMRGEISTLKRASSGHIYFTLKDSRAQMQCAWFRSDVNSAVRLENGMEVVVSGRLGFYTAGGALNFYVKRVETGGTGNLYLMLERLKERLGAEGFFDREHKRSLPAYANKIGVVTSLEGAVIRDIVRVCTRRAPGIQITIYPVKVQGEGAAAEIARGVALLNKHGGYDALIVGRGGGSFEDLFEFNSEAVVKAVYASKIPVISAVGHETDYTLCDMAADVRAATPSEAAELVTVGNAEAQSTLAALVYNMKSALAGVINRKEGELRTLTRVCEAHSPTQMLDNALLGTDMLLQRMTRSVNTYLASQQRELSSMEAVLSAHNSQSILKRGYALVYAQNGSVISGTSELKLGDSVKISMSDGSVNARIGD